jgi:two-component system sensor histidine kinase NreB
VIFLETEQVNAAKLDGNIVTDEKGTIISIDQNAQDMFLLTEVKETAIQQLIPSIDILGLKGAIDSVCQGCGRRSNGEEFPISVCINAFTLPFSDQQVECLSFIVKDLTKDNVVQKQLDRSMVEIYDLKYALDESSIVAITDNRGKITYVNKKFCEVSKFPEEELLGQNHRIINSGFHTKGFFRTLWETISNGSVWKGEIKNRAKDGSYYWVDTTIVPFLDEDGKPYQYLSIRTEITKNKNNEKRLQQSLNELIDLKAALDASTIVAITDQKGKITYVNDKFCEVSKYSEGELIGADHRIINSGYHSQEFIENLWRTISNGHIWKGEIKNRAKDGSYYWVDTTIVPFVDEEGKPYQYLAIRAEITDRKEAEEELKQMMTKMIDIQEEERKRLSRELHDGVGQNLYSLLITINRVNTVANHPLLTQLQEDVSRLIEDVRGISWELRPSILDDLGLIPATRSFINRYKQYYEIDVHLDMQLNRRLPLQVETTIYRIIQEALTNIRKYADVQEAFVDLFEDEDSIYSVIKDKGKGFNLDKFPKGVGLFSMEERARSVGGRLFIQSNLDQGTTITFKLNMKDN